MKLIPAAIRSTFAVVAAALAAMVPAATAFAHADLLRSAPRDGQVLRQSPRAVVLTFDEGIEPAFVRLRVQDTAGRRVARGEPYHPEDREEQLAIRLEPGLEGRLVTSYRVISRDGHPVTRRLAFEVRPPAPADGESAEQGPAPPGDDRDAMPPARDDGAIPAGGAAGHEEGESGPVTSAAFATARGLGYVAMALAIGGIVFLLVVWLPSLGRTGGASPEWTRLSERFVRWARGVVLGAVALGLLVTALAIVFEGATAAGVSFWAALDPNLLEVVFETRVVQAWSARLVLWLLLGGMVLAVLRPGRMPVLRRAALGADGTALASGPSRAQAIALFGVMGALAATAPLGGHAASHGPGGLLAGCDTIHVLCVCTWLGGLVMLAGVLPLGARALSHDASPLLATVAGRFSRLALLVVTLLLLSGIVNAVVLVGSIDALVETAYGRLVLAKIALLAVVLALGGFNQRRLLPALRLVAVRREQPGHAAAVLRRSVVFEIGFAVAILGVTSVLVVTQPAAGREPRASGDGGGRSVELRGRVQTTSRLHGPPTAGSSPATGSTAWMSHG